MNTIHMPRLDGHCWGWVAFTPSGGICGVSMHSRYQAWRMICDLYDKHHAPIAEAQLNGFRVRRTLAKSTCTMRPASSAHKREATT